ncbi:MAG: hypothetical protein GY861_20295 [bacterium]|nr:hypothetical protein [bacterium]
MNGKIMKGINVSKHLKSKRKPKPQKSSPMDEESGIELEPQDPSLSELRAVDIEVNKILDRRLGIDRRGAI